MHLNIIKQQSQTKANTQINMYMHCKNEKCTNNNNYKSQNYD